MTTPHQVILFTPVFPLRIRWDMSLGIFLGLLTAILTSIADALSKKVSSRESVYAVSMSRWLFSLPILFVVNYDSIVLPNLNLEVVLWLIVVAPLEVVAMFLYIKAISRYDLSLVVPFLSLTPLLLLLTGYIFLGERVSIFGMAGVFTIVAGIYIMNVGDLRDGVLKPFKNIFSNRGAVYVIVVAIIYTITSTIGKRIVLLVGPSFMSFWYLASLTIALLMVVIIRREDVIKPLKENILLNLSIGTFVGLAAFTLFSSYKFVPVSYAIALKRSSILFAVLWGRLFFGERDFQKRILGSLIILTGIVLIVLKA